MAQPSAPGRVRRVQRVALTLLVLAGTLNYIDRWTLSMANPLIRQDLGLDLKQMGVLLSAFLWAYAFSQLPGGALVDRVGPRRLLGAGLALWSLAQAAAGMVTGLAQFAAARVFLGAGEAPMFSGAVRVVRDWYNVRDRALPTGIWNA
ncbi:MAG: MFS transporter, partial [Alphaproteobacteria bacterium]|nr:MFS transporter [Alphaproteobacteria bacterium]